MKYGCIFIVLIVLGVVAWLANASSQSHASIKLTQVDQVCNLAAYSPPFQLDGNMRVIYQGHLDGDATLDVVSNRGRDRHQIRVKPGEVMGNYGGAEDWVDDIQVRYTPGTARSGHLYLSVYCGKKPSREDALLLAK
jgi:hypothetical protein